jgi:hypothetical protein
MTVMAMRKARMPAPVEEATPSHGGREGIDELED